MYQQYIYKICSKNEYMDVGGQAVIEGVMMRNKEKFAIAVRLKNGKIRVKKDKSTTFPKSFNIPFLRGAIGLFYMLYDGIRALIWSGNQQAEEKEKLTKKEIILTLVISLSFSLFFFIGIPFFAANFMSSSDYWFNIFDGIFRIIVFIGYLVIISFMKDVKILFQYHGAEHKSIACYEAKQELTVDNVKNFSRFHPRCGTSFIFIVLILSIIIFTLISGPMWVKFLGRIMLLPVIAGIGYELIKLSAKYSENPIVKVLIAPGLWLQRLTTKEPNEKQIEVGIKSLKAVIN